MSRIFIHRESYMLDLTLEVKDNTSWVKNNISRTGSFVCDTIEPFEFRTLKTPDDYIGEIKYYSTLRDGSNKTLITNIFTPSQRNTEYTIYAETTLPSGELVRSNFITVSDKRTKSYFKDVQFNIIDLTIELH